ncbi:hypothetical protein E4U14_001637 [Claviceps sp. LM454 group G7]|nr:hypothetical protein E4U14_001637 [Claviceps sp. LM454 group G7]
MSAARSAHSLLGRCIASTRTRAAVSPAIVVPCQQFHSSAPCYKRRSRVKSVTAAKLGLLKRDDLAEQMKNFADYTEEEMEILKHKYTPEQLEALKAGEEAINPDDLLMQGRFREDPNRPTYVDDYTVLDPRYDLKPPAEVTPQELEWPSFSEWVDKYCMTMTKLTEKKTSDQLTRAMVRAVRRVKESNGANSIDLTDEELNELEANPDLLDKYVEADEKKAKRQKDSQESEPAVLTLEEAEKISNAISTEWEKEFQTLLTDKNEREITPTNLELLADGPAGLGRADSALAPELGKVPGVVGLYKSAKDPEDEGNDDAGYYQEIKRMTGLKLKEIQSIYRKVLVTRWVSNQTRLGKVRSTAVVAIAGNGNGRLGIGVAKSTEPGVASETAQLLAIRNMKPIRRYENRTIFGTSKAKISGTVVELFSRPPGFGLRVPHRIFEMCRASGIHDIHARMPRSKNPMNSVKATYQALTNQVDPEEIAIGRGKKLVDVRKVYYGGAVH